MRATGVKGIKGAVLGTVGLVALMVGVTPIASAGVVNTPHNLATGGTIGGPGDNAFTATDTAVQGQVCVFCHTPHGADTSAAVPLWNRVLSAPSVYKTYDSLGTTSLDGKTAPVGSVSIACLSCHDGTQAMNTMINIPGSGGYVPVTGSDLPGTWTGDTTASTTKVGSLDYTTTTNTNIANIGTDLSNDHPIGIQYGGGGLTASAPTGTTNDLDFVAPSTDLIGGKQVWWINTDTATAARDKADIQLYTRTMDTVDQPFVECASCHNPHSENPTFLRIPNKNSDVCLACHIK